MAWESQEAMAQAPATGGWESAAPEAPKAPAKGWESEASPTLPMPGIMEATSQGVKSAIAGLGQTVTAFSSVAPEPIKETSPAAAPFEWKDLAEPINRGLPKVGYRMGAASPTLAAGVLGGMGGSAAGTLAAGPAGTVAGGIGGGVIGSAAGAAVQTIGPVFAEELKKNPNDPQKAWDSALHQAEISGAFAGASWAAFPIRFFQGPVKQLAFQALGVQPGLAVGEQATKNVVAGKPVTDDLGHAYVEGAVGTTVPAVGHALVSGGLRGKPPVPEPPPTPAQVQLKQMSDQKRTQADALDQMATLPGTTPQDKWAFNKQADQVRQQANHDDFQASLPQDPIKDRKGLSKTWVENFQPELVSDKALKTEPLFSKFKSGVAQMKDAVIARAEENYYKWNKVPFDETRRFLEAYELGQALPPDLVARYPWMNERATKYREWLKQAYQDENRSGSKAAFFDDYFPHIWKDPAAARKVFQNANLPQALGPKWFQKARYYDLIEHGIQNGLELKSHNPEDLVAMRLVSGADMRAKMDLLGELHANGVAVPTEMAPHNILNPGRGDPHPWKEVIAPNSSKWMIAPDVQPLWENAVVAKGLWANEALPGTLFNKWMTLKNAWVPIKLGLSLFHPIHVAHISISNNVSRALGETFGKGQQSLGRRAVAIPEAVAQSVMDTALALPIGTPYKGKQMRQAWMTTPDKQTPQQKADVKLMNEAGISAQLPEQMRIAAKRDFHNALKDGKYLSAIYPGVRRTMEKATGWIFEQWIPNLKVAAVKREAETLFRRDPSLLNDPQRRMIAMRAIGKQVDNRFGEMFYGSLFWNRTVKDASIGSFLSLGWNLGFSREFIGGALEPAARRMIDAPTPTRALIRSTTNKATNALVYTFTAMTINALINKSMTGENPEGMDYIFPRIGGLNPDGSPRRISNPFYTREVPMAEKNIEERQSTIGGLSQMLYHKLMFAPFVEMGTNRDYFGRNIYDENAPGFKQVYQFGKHLLTEQLNPMSISGAKKALELSGKPHTTADVFKQITDSDVIMPIMGFGPAPAYASKSATQNRISYLYNKYVAPSSKPYTESENSKERADARNAYLMAQQKGDRTKMLESAQTMAKLGVKGQNIVKMRPGGNIEYMFQRLPESQQIDLMKQMDPKEFKEFYPKASRKSRADAEIKLLSQFYYR